MPAPGHHPKWLAHLLRPINHRYGTYRGLIRLWLTHVLLALRGRSALTRIEVAAVRRVVFVCQGNICRSPFAEVTARQLGMRATSCGLATGGNVPAFPLAVEAARGFGVDLRAHRTRDIEDFRFEPGDLVLAMELRHLRRLRPVLAGKPVQVSLLGLWAPRPRPHLHDPHKLDAEYFQTCFRVMTASVQGLALRLQDAPVFRGGRG
jgi:low molecular weight protein-tyrosine phosphatase